MADMRFEMRGIGRVAHASIDLDGISVIAGVNNTDKSTVGKAMFSLIDGRFDLDHRMVDHTKRQITLSVRENFIDDIDQGYFAGRVTQLQTIQSIVDEYLDSLDGRDDGRRLIEKLTEADISLRDADEVRSTVTKELARTVEQYASQRIRTELNALFHGDPFSRVVGYGDDSVLSLVDDRGLLARWRTNAKRPPSFKGTVFDKPNVILVENPRLADNMQSMGMQHFGFYGLRNFPMAAVRDAAWKFQHERGDLGQCEVDVLSRIQGISKVDITPHSGEYDGSMVDHTLAMPEDQPYQSMNASMGVKALVTLQLLVQRGAITADTVLILDEPEIHLHPEWQIEYARILAYMSRHMGVHVVVTTHSPYFLDALHTYARHYGFRDRYHVYTPWREENGMCIFEEIDEDGQAEYMNTLADPFDRLAMVDEDAHE